MSESAQRGQSQTEQTPTDQGLQAIEYPFEQAVRWQKGAGRFFLNGLEMTARAQNRSVQLTRSLFDDYIRTLEQTTQETESMAQEVMQTLQREGQAGQQFARQGLQQALGEPTDQMQSQGSQPPGVGAGQPPQPPMQQAPQPTGGQQTRQQPPGGQQVQQPPSGQQMYQQPASGQQMQQQPPGGQQMRQQPPGGQQARGDQQAPAQRETLGPHPGGSYVGDQTRPDQQIGEPTSQQETRGERGEATEPQETTPP